MVESVLHKLSVVQSSSSIKYIIRYIACAIYANDRIFFGEQLQEALHTCFQYLRQESLISFTTSDFISWWDSNK